MSKNVNGVAGDWYLSYLFVRVTLIRNRSKNYNEENIRISVTCHFSS